jgi:putative ABC transport system permease protein
MLEGRTFMPDEPASPRRVIISHRVAQLLWPGQRAIGRTFIMWKGQGNDRAEVIGVVGDMRERGLEDDPTMAVYLAMGPKNAWGDVNLVIRTTVDPLSTVRDLRTAVASVDPHLPMSDVRALDAAVASSVATRRFTMLLLAGFAALALVLALAGVGGVLAYAVARRAPEIGLRLALGAEPRALLRFVLAGGMRPVSLGLAIGLAGALAMSRLMASLLFGITAWDPMTYAAVAIGLLAATLVACYIPARTVLAMDPAKALRTE